MIYIKMILDIVLITHEFYIMIIIKKERRDNKEAGIWVRLSNMYYYDIAKHACDSELSSEYVLCAWTFGGV